MKKTSLQKKALVALGGLGALSASALAGSVDSGAKGVVDPVVAEDPDLCETIWDIPHIYSNPDAFWLTDFKFIGRYHLQYVNIDSSRGGFSDWINRRWRAGAEARILGGDFKVKGEINIDPDFNPFYRSLEEAYVAWEPSDEFNITVGKQKAKWGYEWAISSRKILTFERSLITNRLLPAKSPGVAVSGDVDRWSYLFGLYSGDLDREFGGFDAGVFALGSIGYDYTEDTSFDKMVVRFDWLYNGDSQNNATAPYRHSFSLNHTMEQGKFALGTDLIYADGFDDDAYGVVVLPSYDITDKLQFVTRYSYAHGDNDSLRGGRFERAITNIGGAFRGEDHHSIYAGLNYYLCDHKLKLMTGIQYADMSSNTSESYDAWTFFSGLRLYY